VAVALGDHCVLRTANDTVAGGRVVAVNPRRHRRNDPAVTRDLELRLGGSLEERLLDRLHTSPATQATLGSLLAASGPETDEAVGRLKAAGEVVEREGTLFAAAWMAAAGGRLADALQAYLAANPLRGAVPREHVRAAIGLEAVVFDVVVSEAVAAGRCEARGSGLAPAGYEVALPPAQAAAAADLLRRLREGGASPPTDGLPPAALLSYLAERGQIEVTAAGVVFDRAVYEGMVARTVDWARANGSITLAEARDLFGTSRKYAQAFLEHLDERRVLRRVGDGHVLRDGP
jgi:selenocysteine-specific elongation factor